MTQVNQRAPAALNIGLWVAQAVLALAFGTAGLGKLLNAEAFAARMGMPSGVLRFIGASELAGAIGVVLPALTRIKPALTPIAAQGLADVAVLAVGFHVMRGEWGPSVFPFGLAVLALFVALGRWRGAPIAPRA